MLFRKTQVVHSGVRLIVGFLTWKHSQIFGGILKGTGATLSPVAYSSSVGSFLVVDGHSILKVEITKGSYSVFLAVSHELRHWAWRFTW